MYNILYAIGVIHIGNIQITVNSINVKTSLVIPKTIYVFEHKLITKKPYYKNYILVFNFLDMYIILLIS